MPKKYFTNFPIINYYIDNENNTTKIVDITLRTKLKEILKDYAYVYYNYTIEDGERPDTIAAVYYGHSDYYWLVLMSNDIFNPLFEWPLDTEALNNYINDKYKSLNDDINGLEYAYSTIKYYYDINNNIIDQEEYNELNDYERSTITIYDWEFNENEKKRDIQLISNRYLDIINDQISIIFSE